MGRRANRRERREQDRQEMLRRHQEGYEQETRPAPPPLSESPEMQNMVRDSQGSPPPQAPQVVKQGMSTGHKWTLALVVVLVLVLVAPRACRWFEEASCTADGGRVITHNLTGREACDKPPFADNIFDLGSNDFWLE